MARAPSDGCGVPLAMWIMPSTPSSSAVQPIAGPDGLGVAVRVPQEPPGQQHGQHRDDPGERAERVDRHGVDGPPRRVAHPAPQRGPEHDGHAEGEQPQAVPAVMRVQVARAAADAPGGEPDRAGHRHPGGRDRPAGPSDQDDDGIRRRRAGRPPLGSAALPRAALRPCGPSPSPACGPFPSCSSSSVPGFFVPNGSASRAASPSSSAGWTTWSRRDAPTSRR